MRLEAGDDEIDEALEGGLFVLPRKRPVGVVGHRAIGSRIGVTEQVLQSSLAGERVPLQVKEQVSRRRVRQTSEAEARVHRQQLVHEHPGLAALNLDSGLLAHAFVRLRGAARRLPAERQRHCRERRYRLDTLALQLLDLELGRRRPRARGGRLPSGAAHIVPSSGICRNGLSDRDRFPRSPVVYRFNKAQANAPKVCAVIVHPVRMRLRNSSREQQHSRSRAARLGRRRRARRRGRAGAPFHSWFPGQAWCRRPRRTTGPDRTAGRCALIRRFSRSRRPSEMRPER